MEKTGEMGKGFGEKANREQKYQALLKEQLNREHPLYKLGKAIDWEKLERELRVEVPNQGGRKALPTRLIVGLHYLKAMYNESDESVVNKWVENPYWQYFCGEEKFCHEIPCHPTSLTKWRKRVGAEGVEKLLGEILRTAMSQGALKAREIRKVNVDTTVQEKAIAFPTDARLYEKARKALVKWAKEHEIKLRQSYVRLGKKALLKQSQNAAARRGKEARKETRKLRTYLGRVIRDIERQVREIPKELGELLETGKKIYEQKRTDKGKVYSVHAPETECIGKGKVEKRYEFGCKVVLVTSAVSNWIVGIDAVHGNPYDGATLSGALSQTKELTQVKPEQACVDKGFRGEKHHPEDVKVVVAGTRQLTRTVKNFLKRRSAIEPVIGHTKQDHSLGRNHLRGQIGDRINALLAGCGFNLRKLFRFFTSAPLAPI